MFKVTIICIGKTKEKWLVAALQEYEKRLKKNITFKWVFTKCNQHMLSYCQKIDDYVCLDLNGSMYSSLTFSNMIYQLFEEMGSRLTFIIGGDEGIDQTILSKAKLSISLSPLTFTHQMSRLILLEQIYRSYKIQEGKQYHK
jgi:23S rRNA (pseudouridine1915-N3)-methyltransferase